MSQIPPSQFPPSQNPFQAPAQQPPHQPFGSQPTKPSDSNPLLIPAIILCVMASLWLLYGLLTFVIAMTQEIQPLQPEEKLPFMVGYYSVAFGIPIFGAAALLGSIAMLRRKSYGMALTGAIVAMLPICGPCCGLSIPFGIWALVVMLKPEVKSQFF